LDIYRVVNITLVISQLQEKRGQRSREEEERRTFIFSSHSSFLMSFFCWSFCKQVVIVQVYGCQHLDGRAKGNKRILPYLEQGSGIVLFLLGPRRRLLT
jgi:hypothetical protein